MKGTCCYIDKMSVQNQQSIEAERGAKCLPSVTLRVIDVNIIQHISPQYVL
jgi:hypothetical protein